jgi:hypothetical protein
MNGLMCRSVLRVWVRAVVSLTQRRRVAFAYFRFLSIPFVVRGHPRCVTQLADSPGLHPPVSAALPRDINILRRERVVPLAVSRDQSARPPLRVHVPDVVAWGPGEKMRRVKARRIVAPVADEVPFGDRTVEQFVNVPVPIHLPTVYEDTAIPRAAWRYPAFTGEFGLRHELEEQLGEGVTLGHDGKITSASKRGE